MVQGIVGHGKPKQAGGKHTKVAHVNSWAAETARQMVSLCVSG